MPIKYSIHQNPPREDVQAGGHHIRVSKLSALNTLELAAKATTYNNHPFSEGVIAGVLTDLATWLGDALAEGHAVTLNGIGTFEPRVDGKVEDRASGLTVSGLKVGNVVFKPSAELLEDINDKVHFERELPLRSGKVSDAEVDEFLDEHFAGHDQLQRHHLEERFRLSKRHALDLIQRLVTKGSLRRAPATSARTAAYVRG